MEYNKNIKISLKPIQKDSPTRDFLIENLFPSIVAIIISSLILSITFLYYNDKITTTEANIKEAQVEYDEYENKIDKPNYDLDYNDSIIGIENEKHDYSLLYNDLHSDIEENRVNSIYYNTILNEQLNKIVNMSMGVLDGRVYTKVEFYFENHDDFVKSMNILNKYSISIQKDTKESQFEYTCNTTDITNISNCNTDGEIIKFNRIEVTVELLLNVGVLNEK